MSWAFGFQLLLTNLSVAAGISYVGHHSSDGSSSSSGGSTRKKISTAFGVWDFNYRKSGSSFFACLLAVKPQPVQQCFCWVPLPVWSFGARIFCLLFWVSSTTVGSPDWVGGQDPPPPAFSLLVGAATAAVGAPRSAGNQIVETAEATAAAVRKEITAAWGWHRYWGQPAGLPHDPAVSLVRHQAILEAEFERLIQDSDIASIADRDTLSQLNRDTFEKLVSSRTDFVSARSSAHCRPTLHQLASVPWAQSAGQNSVAELVDYLKSASPRALVSEELGDRLDEFLAEYRKQRQGQQSSPLSSGISNASTP